MQTSPPDEPPPGPAAPTARRACPPTVRQGSTGPVVRRLQRDLTAAGYPVTEDGVFGSRTTQAVRQFQSAQGLAVDGVCGPRTWQALGAC